jgi:hypothetical protein
MALVDQWRAIETSLPQDWADVRLELRLTDRTQLDKAAALLGPLTPGVLGANRIRFFAARRGAGPGPDQVRRALAHLDQARVKGNVVLLATDEATATPPTHRLSLAEAWDAVLGTLPDDWSDLYCELELRSSDDLERGALHCAPLNPSRYGGTPGFRFRVARRFGYGASPQMVRRCLERLDAAQIPGEVRVLRALSDTKPAQTQGPVWYVGGRSV